MALSFAHRRPQLPKPPQKRGVRRCAGFLPSSIGQSSVGIVTSVLFFGAAIGCSGAEDASNPSVDSTVAPSTSGGGAPVTVGSTGETSGAPVPAGVTPGQPGTGVTEPGPGPTQTPPSTPVDVSNADCSVPKAPATLMRRLTAFEFRNAVTDVFGVTPTTQIPLDGVTDGYDNNTSVLNVSSLHAEKFVLASEEVAKVVGQNVAEVAPCSASESSGEEVCARSFARQYGRLVFRRDLTAEDEASLMSAYAIGREGGSYAEGIEVMVRAMIQSPHFLYRVERAQQTAVEGSNVAKVGDFELATRLSFLIWASGPDDALLDAAANGELATKDQVAAWARTMLSDERAKRGVVNFYEQWLGTSKIGTTQKNQSLFPAYNPQVQSAMAAELPAFMNHVLWDSDRKLASMFTSSVAFVNTDLAPIYGVPGVRAPNPTMVELPNEQDRAGVLTQAGFLAVQAHPDQTSPVLRGKFVRTKLMCQPPPPPPPDADITPPDASEAKTARQRFSAHAEAGNSCSGCHLLMDPIGFAFEHFDAVGQFRLEENGETIDVSGEIAGGTDSLAGPFSGVRELGEKLAASPVVQSCVATQWFRYATGRTEAVGDECSLATLQNQFASSEGDLIELVVAMTQTDAFHYRPVSEVSP